MTDVPPPQPTPPRADGCMKVIMWGCGTLIFLAIIGGIIVYKYRRTIEAEFVRFTVVTVIEEVGIPEEELKIVIAEVDRLAEAYKAEEIDREDFVRIVEELGESPVVYAGAGLIIEKHYLDPSGLTDEEKEAGRRTLQRCVRGVWEDRIPREKLEELGQSFNNSKDEDDFILKESLTDEELKELLESAREVADEAEIPDEPFQIDLAAELRAAVDRALESTRPEEDSSEKK